VGVGDTSGVEEAGLEGLAGVLSSPVPISIKTQRKTLNYAAVYKQILRISSRSMKTLLSWQRKNDVEVQVDL
jgi:hypothetical protein